MCRRIWGSSALEPNCGTGIEYDIDWEWPFCLKKTVFVLFWGHISNDDPHLRPRCFKVFQCVAKAETAICRIAISLTFRSIIVPSSSPIKMEVYQWEIHPEECPISTWMPDFVCLRSLHSSHDGSGHPWVILFSDLYTEMHETNTSNNYLWILLGKRFLRKKQQHVYLCHVYIYIHISIDRLLVATFFASATRVAMSQRVGSSV
jgi:hypothetical protein